jgi:acyl-CoA thioester hydrolase
MSESFSHEFVVDASDIDVFGHASNISVVRWVQETALAHSNAVGLDLETYRSLGVMFVIVRHEIDYLRSAFAGDVLKARTWVPVVQTAKCFRHTEFVRQSDDTLLARGVTTWALVELASGRARRFIPAIRAAFGWDDAALAVP